MSEEAINSNEQEVNEEVTLSPDAHEDVGALDFNELDELTSTTTGEEILSEAKNRVKKEQIRA